MNRMILSAAIDNGIAMISGKMVQLTKDTEELFDCRFEDAGVLGNNDGNDTFNGFGSWWGRLGYITWWFVHAI